nr:uncharacterized protein LOC128677189 [Plodia interpunctella]
MATLSRSVSLKLLDKAICKLSFRGIFGHPCWFHTTGPKHRKYERKYGSNIHLPGSECVQTPFEPLYCMPTDVFRCTHLEEIGPSHCAGKCHTYKNPEYFTYHHLTYYDMHFVLQPFRNPSPQTGRKP